MTPLTSPSPSEPSGLSGLSGLTKVQAQQLFSDYRLTPATLLARLNQEYIASKWVLYLSYKIAQCVSKGSCGLLISAPPRHGKSWLATIATPLWVLENFPHHNVVVTTYGEELSTDFSRQIRDYITQNQNLLNVRLRSDTQRVTNFLTTKGGGLKAVGLRGAITGRGANVFILDDYIKEPKEAMSAQYLEDMWTWYQTVARTRLEPGAVIIIVATRWVKNDIHGRIMKLQELTGRNFFEYVELPALATDNPLKPDALGRSPGEPLFPERYTREMILDIKTELTGRWFEAMFQQNPLGDEGSVIPIEAIQKLSPEEHRNLIRQVLADPQRYVVARYWDLASTKDAGDYTVGARAVFDLKDETFVVDDLVRGQHTAGRVETLFQATSKADSILYPRVSVGLEQEPGSSGAYTIKHFQGLLQEVVPGTMLQAARATSSKLLNAQPYIAHIEQGKTGVVESAWSSDFLEELSMFPEGLHDDQVDATGGAYKMCRGLIGKSVTWGRGADIDALRQSIKGKQTLDASITNRLSATWGR